MENILTHKQRQESPESCINYTVTALLQYGQSVVQYFLFQVLTNYLVKFDANTSVF